MDDDEVVRQIPFARDIAFAVGRTLPAFVEKDDLVSDAYVGLMDAVEKFDPDRGFAFGTYARYRIRGAILDGIFRFEVGRFPVETEIGDEQWKQTMFGVEVQNLLANISAKHQEVLRLHYLDGYTWKEVGTELGVTEGRACQIGKEAIENVRRSL